MTAPTKPARTRPALPRAVAQIRILLWLQFFLMLINSLPLFIYVGILQHRENAAYDSGGLDNPLYTLASDREAQVGKLALWTLGIALLLAICAGLMRRGWIVLYPLIVLAQLAVVTGLVYLVKDEIYIGMGVVLVLIGGGWVLAVLFRPEVWRFIRRDRSAPPQA